MGDVVKKPLISVIVPVYKVEKYLQKCIDSILNQTYENLEIILVDDGSPDNCPRICDEYARRDGRVRVIHKQNGGLSDARNAGLKVFCGEYLMFVDSDDWIEPNYVEAMFAVATRHDLDLVISGVTYTYENEDRKNECAPAGNDVVELVSNSLMGYAWNKLYRRNIVKREFENIIREDMLFNLGVYSDNTGIKYGTTNNCGYNYFQRAGSCLHSSISIKKEQVCEYLLRVHEVLESTHFEGDVREAIFNHIAYVLMADSFAIFVDNCRNVAENMDYVRTIFSSLPKGILKSSYANNKLYRATYLAYETKLIWLYIIYLRIVRRKGK